MLVRILRNEDLVGHIRKAVWLESAESLGSRESRDGARATGFKPFQTERSVLLLSNDCEAIEGVFDLSRG